MDITTARRHTTLRLEREFAAQFDAETVSRFVDQAFAELADHAHVESWIPVLAERFTRQQLVALAKIEGAQDSLPVVLFVDTHDAGRSQLARALFGRHSSERAHAWSGGVHPSLRIQPEVADVLAELQIDLANEFPKPITDHIVRGADVIVRLGDVELDPPATAETVSWSIPELSGFDRHQVAQVRDQVDGRTAQLARDLLG